MRERISGFWRKLQQTALEKFRRASLKQKLTFITSFTVTLILLYCFMIFIITIYSNKRREREEYLHSSFLRKKETLDAFLSRIDYTAYTIMFSNWVQNLMVSSRVASNAELQNYQRNVSHFLSSLTSINDNHSYILLSDSLMLWSNNSLRYDTQYDISKQPWYEQLLQSKKYVEYGRSELFAGLSDTWSMTMYYPVTNYFTFSRIGFLAVNITADKLKFLAEDGSNDVHGELTLVKDQMNYTIVSNIPAGFFSEEGLAKQGWLSYTGSLMDDQWTIQIFRKISLNPFAGLGGYTLVFLLLIPIIALFVMINLSFSRYLSVPIVKCKNAMLEIRNDNFGVTVENHYHDEIGELLDGFNEMSSVLVSLLRQNAIIDKLRRDAEIDALQQKVNPHFLYNTLEIINALILDSQNSEAVQVCEILGQIYHYNLMNRKWVSLRDECDYVRRYLLIFRYKISGLQVVWDLEEEALGTEILKLVLQPLVENAVLHGLRGKPHDPCLTITVKTAGEQTEILIMDNGSGIAPETLADIEQNLELVRKKNFADGPHIGIRNVYQRLYLEYGEQMVFSLSSRPNYGTKMFITLPRVHPLNLPHT